MSLLHADLKTLCRAKGLHVSGTKRVLTDRLIADGKILTERQARHVMRARAEAAARGLTAVLRPSDLYDPQEASRWLTETRKKRQEQRDEAD